MSPILFLFFNADLVRGRITKERGSIAFVDDYLAWVTGYSVQSNVERLQTEVIPHLEQWRHVSRALFQPAKTVLTHFTRRKKVHAEVGPQLQINGVEVIPSNEIKILGVVLDSRLVYRSHIAKATKKGVRSALALKRLRNLRPEVARQLYKATVTSKTDYASIIWAPNASLSSLSALERVQRIGAQAIVSAFKTVALNIVEAEAGLEGTLTYLHRQHIATWVKLHSKSAKHHFWKLKKSLGNQELSCLLVFEH